jgi:N-dimethylarginine dimethylaminohydrolase
MVSEGEFQAASGQGAEDKFKDETGLTLREMYQKHHPQVLADFEDEMPKYWGRKWKANSNVGKLRMVLVHRPGNEFLTVGKPTPWPPFGTSLGAWRMSFKPDLDELVEHHENLVDAYKAEGVEVVVRKPDPNDPPYQVKAIYTDDVCHPGVYGSIILRMYDYVRKGEEVPTYQTLAEIGCPVVGMIVGNGMAEGGPIGWLDEKHVVVAVHYPRANCPGYGTRIGASHYTLIDRHTSVQDPRDLDQYLVDWMKAEMDWEFIVPPDDICRIVRSRDERAVLFKRGPETGVVLEHRKILVPTGAPKATKWFESIGVEVVEVECSSLVGPRNSGSIHCAAGALIRDPEPKSY